MRSAAAAVASESQRASRRLGRAHRVIVRVACPLLLCLAGCDVEFTEQELVLRHRPDLDAVDMLFVYHGLTAPNDSEAATAKAADWIEPLLEGGRHMLLVDWPLQFDLETWDAKLQEKLASLPEEAASTREDEQARQLAERARSILAQISVLSSGLFLDGQDRLCGWQVVRLDGITQLLDTANQMLSTVVIESLKEAEAPDEDVDERTRKLLLGAARAGFAWLQLDSDGLRLEAPISAAACARGFASFGQQLGELQAVDKKGLGWINLWGGLLSAVSGFSYADELLSVVLKQSDQSLFDVRMRRPEVSCLADLAEELMRRGHRPEALTKAAIRALLD